MHDDGCKVICKRHGECVRKLEENVKKKKSFWGINILMKTTTMNGVYAIDHPT